jgi:hypothetical protein
MADTIKYLASCKGYSRVLSLTSELKRMQHDVDYQLTGGVSLEEVIAVRDGVAKELEVWKYIFKLIENDNK